MTEGKGEDGRTRRRLVDAATRLFAERGFKHVTVRAICRDARANVAAVNYHFRDKMGLYREVLEAVAEEITQLTADVMRAGEGLPAEARLREYVRLHCHHAFQQGPTARLQQLMHRELQEPTQALSSLIDRVWRPRFQYLAATVGEWLDLPPDDEQVVRSAISIHAQVSMFRPSPAVDRMGPKIRRVFTADAVAGHITAFSLAGLEASPGAGVEATDGLASPGARQTTLRDTIARAGDLACHLSARRRHN